MQTASIVRAALASILGVAVGCGAATRASAPPPAPSSPSAASSAMPRASSAPAAASASAPATAPSDAAAIDPDVLVPSSDPTSTFRRGPAPVGSSDPDQLFQRDESPSEITIAIATGTPDAKQVLTRNRWRFHACHVALLKTSPDAAGTLKLKLKLTEDGKVDAATPAGGTAPAELAACARAQAKQLRFAPPPEDATDVLVVLVFARKG